MGKVLASWSDLSRELAAVRSGRKVVFTNGVFDILHIGHVRYLQEARAQGDLLVVGVNADSSVKKLKGPTRPLQNEGDRAEILAGLGCVDYVTLFSESTPEDLIGVVKPDVFVKGGDYTVETLPEAKTVLAYGGTVKILQFVDGKSSTAIINKMKS
ncbi:MAG: D-glycero-beta-D-manno-heptose 1-phosphate adenylyltransferase [Bdellovibrionota bacterium]